jgi:hypothetical protein
VPTRLFGLDGEMSSSDLDKGGRLIQIGAAVIHDDDSIHIFSELLNPGPNAWSEIAEAVHGYTRAEVAAAPPADIVDSKLVEWLVLHGADRKRRANTVPVGFNVTGFDMPHIRLVLPRTAALFSRRTVDLNSNCYLLEGLRYDGNVLDFDGWKAIAQEYAARVINSYGAGVAAHDAGYDSLMHLHVFHFLRAVADGRPPKMPDGAHDISNAESWSGELIEFHGLAKASALSGVPEVFLNQWAKGGNARNEKWIEQVRIALSV